MNKNIKILLFEAGFFARILRVVEGADPYRLRHIFCVFVWTGVLDRPRANTVRPYGNRQSHIRGHPRALAKDLAAVKASDFAALDRGNRPFFGRSKPLPYRLYPYSRLSCRDGRPRPSVSLPPQFLQKRKNSRKMSYCKNLHNIVQYKCKQCTATKLNF